MNDKLPLSLLVRPVPKDCRRCDIQRRSVTCVMCATLVEDEAGGIHVCLRAFTGARWRKVSILDLIDAPAELQSEGREVIAETLHA